MSKFKLVIMAMLVLMLSSSLLRADDEPPITRLTLYAAAEPRPALRYRLLPALVDLQPGNAAVFYYEAAVMLRSDAEAEKEVRHADEWTELPLDKLPHDDVARAVERWDSILQEVGYAARREQCDWQMPLREQIPYTINLPGVQQLRAFARMLSAKARLAILDRKYDDAVATLQIGYAMARHAARGPTYVHALIGMGIGHYMAAAARDLSQQPGAPNLYWAFSSLPRPFIPLELSHEYEKESIYFWHPEWRDLDRQSLSADEWRKRYDDLVAAVAVIDSQYEFSEAPQLRIVGRAVQGYARAKRWLVYRGRSAEAVERMPVAQVVVLYTLGIYDDLTDQVFKWANLPYPLVYTKMVETEQSVGKTMSDEIFPLTGILLSGVSNVKRAQIRTERSLDLQRTLEALRIYAAAHDGKLPRRLADISQAPVPNDPWFDVPFDYQLSGDTATLKARAPAGLPAEYFGANYEIQIARRGHE